MYIKTDIELMAIHIIAETKRESITNLAASSGEEGPDIAIEEMVAALVSDNMPQRTEMTEVERKA